MIYIKKGLLVPTNRGNLANVTWLYNTILTINQSKTNKPLICELN